MAIATLAYKITADTRKFEAGVKATRKELNLAKRIMRDTTDDTDKMAIALSNVEDLHKKGLLPASNYRKAQQKIREEFGETGEASEKLKRKVGDLSGPKAFGGLKGVVAGMRGPLLAITGAFASMGLSVGTILGGLRDIAALAKESERVGLTPTDLKTLELASRSVGVEKDEVVDALVSLKERLGEAAVDPESDVGQTISRIGLNAKALGDAGALQQLLSLSQGLQQFESREQRIFFANEVFGDAGAKLVPLLESLDVGTYAKYREEVERLFGVVDTESAKRFGGQTARLDLAKEGFTQGVSEEAGAQASRALTPILQATGLSTRDIGRFLAGAAPSALLTGGIVNPFAFRGGGLPAEGSTAAEQLANPGQTRRWLEIQEEMLRETKRIREKAEEPAEEVGL